MKKRKFSYTTDNQLNYFIVLRKYRQESSKGGKVNLRDVEKELAAYCEMTPKAIGDIKRGVNQPSLPVAMRIAAFFHVGVEDIFTLKTKEDIMTEKAQELIDAARELDGPVFARFNNALHEFLEEAKHVGIEDNGVEEEEGLQFSGISNLTMFLNNMFPEGFSNEIKVWTEATVASMEEEQKSE